MPALFKNSLQQMKVNPEFQKAYYECGWKPVRTHSAIHQVILSNQL